MHLKATTICSAGPQGLWRIKEHTRVLSSKGYVLAHMCISIYNTNLNYWRSAATARGLTKKHSFSLEKSKHLWQMWLLRGTAAHFLLDFLQ